MSVNNICTCVADPEITCVVHPSRKGVDKWRARSRFVEHANKRADSENVILQDRCDTLAAELDTFRDASLLLTGKLEDAEAELAELRESMVALQIKWLNSFCRPAKPTPEAIAWDTCIADVAALLQGEDDEV